jgi:hypothetical protein
MGEGAPGFDTVRGLVARTALRGTPLAIVGRRGSGAPCAVCSRPIHVGTMEYLLRYENDVFCLDIACLRLVEKARAELKQ